MNFFLFLYELKIQFTTCSSFFQVTFQVENEFSLCFFFYFQQRNRAIIGKELPEPYIREGTAPIHRHMFIYVGVQEASDQRLLEQEIL